MVPDPQAQATLLPGAVIDGRYRIDRLIGEGGMGRVYAAEHLFLRRRIALKLVRRDAGTGQAAARLLQEAVLAGKVPHATVVPVFDCAALPDGQVYLAMELLRGESLEQALRRPLPAESVLRWLAEVARGLGAAHRAGIVHRDIKPANLFLTRTEEGTVQPRILDFGIAKLSPGMADGTAAIVQTQAGALLGTPHYMAPERVRGEAGGPRSDLYSLGVILYEAITGALPFTGDSFMAIAGRHLREPPLDPRQAAPDRPISDRLAALVLSLLYKDPEARPESGDALAQAIADLLAREGPVLARLAVGACAPPGAARSVAAVRADRSGTETQRLAEAAGGPGAETQRLAGDGLADRSGAETQRLTGDGLADRSGAETQRLGAELGPQAGQRSGAPGAALSSSMRAGVDGLAERSSSSGRSGVDGLAERSSSSGRRGVDGPADRSSSSGRRGVDGLAERSSSSGRSGVDGLADRSSSGGVIGGDVLAGRSGERRIGGDGLADRSTRGARGGSPTRSARAGFALALVAAAGLGGWAALRWSSAADKIEAKPGPGAAEVEVPAPSSAVGASPAGTLGSETTTGLPRLGPGPAVAGPAPAVAGPAPAVVEPAPAVAEPGPAVAPAGARRPAKKSARKVGTTEAGKPGPKIKTDVYEE